MMFGSFGSGWLLGDAMAVVVAAVMALITVVARRHRDIPMVAVAASSSALGALLVWPAAQPLDISTDQILVLCAFGVVNMGFGLALYSIGAKLVPSGKAALIGTLEMPMAPLWVWLAFDERFGIYTAAGGVLIFTAILWSLVPGSAAGGRRPAAQRTP